MAGQAKPHGGFRASEKSHASAAVARVPALAKGYRHSLRARALQLTAWRLAHIINQYQTVH
jgi:hypothetical protein